MLNVGTGPTPAEVRIPRHGTTVAVVLCVGSAVAGSLGAGLAGLAARGLLAASLVAAVVFVQRREGTDYLEFVVWLWLLTPWVRRVIDLSAGYAEQSIVLLCPMVASLPAAIAALLRRPRATRRVPLFFGVACIAILYATLVGAIRNGPEPALVGGLVWIAPLSVGLWALSAPCSAAELRGALRRLAIAGALVLGAYGLVQFFFLPEWDAFWMVNVELVSIGRPFPTEVRVFGPLNAPVPYAMVLGVFVVLASAVRARLRGLAVLLGVIGVALSLVRGAWLGLVVAVFALVTGGRARTLRGVLLVVVVPALLLVSIGGSATEVVVERFGATVEKGSEDTSLTDRVDLYGRELPGALASPAGEGFGPVGAGAGAVDDDPRNETLRSPDSAVLEILIGMGSIVGSVFVLSAAAAVMVSWRRARESDDDFERAIAAALWGLLVQALLANPFTSAPGVLFWVLLAATTRPPPRDDEAAVDLDQSTPSTTS